MSFIVSLIILFLYYLFQGHDMKIWYKPKTGIHRLTKEITIAVENQDELRSLAKYLLDQADLPPDIWEKFGHEHYIRSPHRLSEENDVIITRG
jgi:hypothetical protein